MPSDPCWLRMESGACGAASACTRSAVGANIIVIHNMAGLTGDEVDQPLIAWRGVRLQ